MSFFAPTLTNDNLPYPMMNYFDSRGRYEMTLAFLGLLGGYLNSRHAEWLDATRQLKYLPGRVQAMQADIEVFIGWVKLIG